MQREMTEEEIEQEIGQLRVSFNRERYSAIPPRLRDALIRYVVYHTPTGGFLQAVLQNNLLAAVNRADDVSLQVLPELTNWVAAVPPLAAKGSYEAYKAWTEL